MFGLILVMKTKTEIINITQFYAECVGKFSYIVESRGEAIVIDPLVNPRPYLAHLQLNQLRLKYILNTHVRTDCLMGAAPLAAAVKLPSEAIVFGEKSSLDFAHSVLADGEELKFGKVAVRAIWTPGHSIESTSFLIIDSHGKPHSLFAGETLTLEGVGTPNSHSRRLHLKYNLLDLLAKSVERLSELPAHVEVYVSPSQSNPQVKEGSFTRIGSLQQLLKGFKLSLRVSQTGSEECIANIVKLNQRGAVEDYDRLVDSCSSRLSIRDLPLVIGEVGVIIDTRKIDDLESGFIVGSINIGLRSSFSTWVRHFVSPNSRILLIADDREADECIGRLIRIGYLNIKGHVSIARGTELQDMQLRLDKLRCIQPQGIKNFVYNKHHEILDIREPSEVESRRLPHSMQIPLSTLIAAYKQIPTDKQLFVLCNRGKKSAIAVTWLASRGFSNLTILKGGVKQLEQDGIRFI